MREYITPIRVANSIGMLRGQRDYISIAFLIVEGETDAKVFRNVTHNEKCKVVPAGDKASVLEIR
jgi:hypothetical protein